LPVASHIWNKSRRWDGVVSGKDGRAIGSSVRSANDADRYCCSS
jgi:hypothetical protein